VIGTPGCPPLPTLVPNATVALLGFARDAAAPIGRLRLIVNTGNWTSASLNQQIEMLRVDEIDRRS
jgi:hypothetical protein